MPSQYIYILITLAIPLCLMVVMAIAISRMYQKVASGQALIIYGANKEPKVSFSGSLVIPVIQRAEIMDITLKTIEISRRGTEGLSCRDGIRADIEVSFFLHVNHTANDILKVAQLIGCARASDQNTLDNLFTAKFSEALKVVAKQIDFEQLYAERTLFKEKVIEMIGADLNGFVLEDATIDKLFQTPLESLDPNNILDAPGIRKIKMMTKQHAYT